MKPLVKRSPNGTWSIDGVDLSQLDGKVYGALCKLKDYEASGLSPDEVLALRESAQPAAFALACRMMTDYLDCPAAEAGADWPECQGKADACGDLPRWACWKKYLLEVAETESVCRVCGCTQQNACPGGCWWVEEDLCSACAAREEGPK